MMPMVSNQNENEHVAEHGEQNLTRMDGTMVSRTTNFSTKKPDEDRAGIQLEDKDMFNLLLEAQAKASNVESLIHQRFFENQNETNTLTDEQKREYADLFTNMMKYTAVPGIMQDTDKSYVGAWKDKVEDLKLTGVKLASNSVELYMARDQDSTTNSKTQMNVLGQTK
jgi:hypothetical protein